MGYYFGGHAMWDHNHPEFLIASDDPGFFKRTCRDLQTINSADVGQRLLAMISQQCKGIGLRKRAESLSVKIEEAMSEVDTGQEDDFKYNGLRRKRREGLNYRAKGTGTASTVQYRNNPEMVAIYTTYIGVKTPPFTMLAHELIHALHSLSGDNRGLYATVGRNPMTPIGSTRRPGPSASRSTKTTRFRRTPSGTSIVFRAAKLTAWTRCLA